MLPPVEVTVKVNVPVTATVVITLPVTGRR